MPTYFYISVLSDGHMRAIYDNLGTAGLETQGWEIVQRTKTPHEIREEYERLARWVFWLPWDQKLLGICQIYSLCDPGCTFNASVI